MKQQMISEISNRLSGLGVPVQKETSADIVINAEFLDASWSTGNKKINYEASLFANETEKVVYLYEKTTESGQGISFGGNSETSFQSGTTLFRKVKSIQYGPDGVAYEYTLDIGVITKTIKEVAKEYGWKVKTVIDKKKAVFPIGYIPISSVTNQTVMNNQKMSENETFYVKQNGAEVKKDLKPKNRGSLAYIILAIIFSLLFYLLSVSIVGWVIAVTVFLLFFILHRKLAGKGCFIQILLWILVFVFLLIIMVLTSSTDKTELDTEVVEDNNKEETQDSDVVEDQVVNILVKLPYEKSFTLDDGKSIGKFKLFISDGTGIYEDYKDEVICEFYVKFDTSTLPKDFIMTAEQATQTDASGQPGLDALIMAVCSDTEAYHRTGLSYAQAIYNNGDVRPFLETEGATTGVDADFIKEIADKYPKMQILRYNSSEVDITQEGDGWTTHGEQAFGLHPPVTEGSIPWEEILKDLGLD